MPKQFLSWMAAGLGGILAAALMHFQSGASLSFKTGMAYVGGALLVRAANWIVAVLGPKPAA